MIARPSWEFPRKTYADWCAASPWGRPLFRHTMDDDHSRGSGFIGSDVAASLSHVDPIGKSIRAETHEYKL